jgi:Nif-specific regulatory protein
MLSVPIMANADRTGDRGDLDKVVLEARLCRRLLDLNRQTALAPFLEEALALIVEVIDVSHGYLELYDESATPQWSIATGFTEEDVAEVRRLISRGIISAAIAAGETVVTASAREDLRFSNRESVLLGNIEAVLCTPIGEGRPRGVLYLQGAKQPGPFSAAEQELAELFARQLGTLADRILEEHRRRQQTDATASIRTQLRAEGIVGRSLVLADLLRQAALVAPLDITVLLTGESGCGKSQLARVIHDNSPRASEPFVEVNCGALPETLIESELFGAEAGAHSTATKRIEGKVAAAGRGTLLLDEIGVLPLGAQAKLLQLLQSKEYYPLGASRPSRCEARVIAATNTDLQRAVVERQFREDLYYRLEVLPMRVPSLRERREDIEVLADHFSARFSALHGFPRLALSSSARVALQTAEWPGNIRQLGHALEAAAIRAAGEGARAIEARHLFPDRGAPEQAFQAPTYQEATRLFQAALLRQALLDTSWNVAETAKRLDLARSYVYDLIHAFGLKRDDSRS